MALPVPSERVRVIAGYGSGYGKKYPGVTRADHYMPPVGSTGEDVTSAAARVHSGLPLYDSSDSSVESGASESSYEGL